MTAYIDAHCHLDLLSDPSRALDQAPHTVVVSVTELPSQYRLLTARFRNDRRVHVALGLHPLRAATAGPLEEGQLFRQLGHADYVGEVGLDFSRRGRDTRTAQLRVFDRLLAEPEVRKKVLTVHSRGAEDITIQRLHEAGVRATLHWFTGPTRLIDDALDAGLYFSINPAMLRTERGRQTIVALPHHRVLTETDAPFAKLGGREARPRDIRLLVAELAKRWNSDLNYARKVVHANFAMLYGSTVGDSAWE